jgi:hypothetical protein
MNLLKSLALLLTSFAAAAAGAAGVVIFPDYAFFIGFLSGWWACLLTKAANRALKAHLMARKWRATLHSAFR